VDAVPGYGRTLQGQKIEHSHGGRGVLIGGYDAATMIILLLILVVRTERDHTVYGEQYRCLSFLVL
jgi:hypothetical protein